MASKETSAARGSILQPICQTGTCVSNRSSNTISCRRSSAPAGRAVCSSREKMALAPEKGSMVFSFA